MRRIPDDNFDLASYVGDVMSKLQDNGHPEA